MTLEEKIVKQIRKYTTDEIEVGMILGSGWNVIVEQVENPIIIKYENLKGMPTCSVKGHGGNFVIGNLHGKKAIIMQGRFHLYEGYDSATVTLPVRVMKLLGVNLLVVTNAAGGCNADYKPGDIMIIDDHINMTGKNPLIGVKMTDEMPIFIDMSAAYDKELGDVIENVCKENGYGVQRGVYMQLLGPSYETASEVKMARTLGADAVGMSTVQEVILAKYLGMKVVGITCISNLATGISPTKLNHQEVLDVTKQNKVKYEKILTALMQH